MTYSTFLLNFFTWGCVLILNSAIATPLDFIPVIAAKTSTDIILADPEIVPVVETPPPIEAPKVAPVSILPQKCHVLADLEIRADKKPVNSNADKSAHNKVAIERLYESMHDIPLWSKDGQATPQAKVLLQYLSQADRKGLAASVYVGNIDWVAYLQGANDPTERTCRDLAFSTTAMRYISNLRVGQVNPRKLGIRLDFSSKQIDLSEVITKLAAAENPGAILDGLEPTLPPYKALIRSLQRYFNNTSNSQTNVKLATIRKSIHIKEHYQDATLLAQRLEAWGDLPTGQFTVANDGIYTPELAQGVAQFQKRNGLRADGVLGPNTIRAINTPVTSPEKKQNILIALERWRWMPDNLGYRPIVVNIPEYKLYALESDDKGWYQVAFDMNVIVGKSEAKYNTPSVHSSIRSIEFTPYWNVPMSILRRELYDALKGDPSYASSHNYEIVRSLGPKQRALPINSGTLSGLWQGSLRLRQKPGNRNALGEAKFVFPNDYSVYLHGTPNKSLFNKKLRALSHGCVRVSNPGKLAAHLLRYEAGWDQARVDHLIASKKHQQVNIAKPAAVYLIYDTTVVQPDGTTRLFPDVYGYDPPLMQALEQAKKEVPLT